MHKSHLSLSLHAIHIQGPEEKMDEDNRMAEEAAVRVQSNDGGPSNGAQSDHRSNPSSSDVSLSGYTTSCMPQISVMERQPIPHPTTTEEEGSTEKEEASTTE